MIKFGSTVKDRITGFVGVVTGYVQYITGCNQYLLAQPAKDGEFKESIWLDEGRLDLMGDIEAVSLARGNNPGFDKPPYRGTSGSTPPRQ